MLLTLALLGKWPAVSQGAVEAVVRRSNLRKTGKQTHTPLVHSHHKLSAGGVLPNAGGCGSAAGQNVLG